MSIQEFSDGTLPDYFHNLWRKKFMTEEEIKREQKQLEKLYMTNSISIYEKNENCYVNNKHQKMNNQKKNNQKKTNNEYNHMTKTEKKEQ